MSSAAFDSATAPALGTESLPPRRKGGRPTRRTAEEIGRRIMEAARKLFLANGFAATSMDAVAVEARVSKATLYARHQDKETLFQALALDILDKIVKRSDRPEITAPGLPLRARLEVFAEQIAATFTLPEVQGLVRAVAMEGERFPALITLLREEGEQRGARIIRDLLASAPETRGASEEDLRRGGEIFLHLFRPPPRLTPYELRDCEAEMEKFRADKAYRLDFFLRGLGVAV